MYLRIQLWLSDASKDEEVESSEQGTRQSDTSFLPELQEPVWNRTQLYAPPEAIMMHCKHKVMHRITRRRFDAITP
jgi:hypothetical protein